MSMSGMQVPAVLTSLWLPCCAHRWTGNASYADYYERESTQMVCMHLKCMMALVYYRQHALFAITTLMTTLCTIILWLSMPTTAG
jgi:hypothetical protein